MKKLYYVYSTKCQLMLVSCVELEWIRGTRPSSWSCSAPLTLHKVVVIYVLWPKMNKEEAQSVFESGIERFRAMPYNDLVRTIGKNVYTAEHVGESGKKYQIDIKTKWKSRKKNVVRVSGRLRNLDPSPEKSKTWNIPLLGIAFCRSSQFGIFTTFTRRAE